MESEGEPRLRESDEQVPQLALYTGMYCTVYTVAMFGVQADGADPVPAAEDAGARAQVPPPPPRGRPRDGQHLLLVRDKPILPD